MMLSFLCPWPSRLWPCSPEEETAFVRSLGEPCGGWHLRSDVTAVVTALRCGASLEQMRVSAPGIDPARLASAYADVSLRLARVNDAFAALVGDSRLARRELVGGFSALLPYAAHRLSAHAENELLFSAEVSWLAERVVLLRAHADSLFALIAESGGGDEARLLGVRLFHPHRPCLFSHPLFLPRRVGELSVSALADLLGERRDSIVSSE